MRSLRAEIARPVGMKISDVQARLINPSRNFFKHADRDPNAILNDFRDDECDHVLLMPCYDIVELEKKSPIEAQVFLVWYAALYPSKILDGTDWKMAAEEKFPKLSELPRHEQKRRAVDMLNEALNHAELMAHPETDMREVDRWR